MGLQHAYPLVLYHQQINYRMRILVFFMACLVVSLGSLCDQPQRTFYMSYPSLSKRDALNNLFDEVSRNMTALDSNYTDSNLEANFRIISLLAGTYYNDHRQSEAYLDKYRVNVTMGQINVGSRFNYSIAYRSSNKTGTIFARGKMDQSSFTKNLTLQKGYLEWAPDVVPALTFTQFFLIESSEPKLTEQELNIFEKMLNNEAGSRKIKSDIAGQINNLYGPLLKDHLNHEDLISSNNITYKYRNITLTFENYAKDFYMSNGNTKGLEAFFIFGLQSSTENCTALGKEFDEDQYSGLQQIVSFSTLRAMIKEALSKGLYDVTLDRTWETPGFQLFMGDLGNSVPYANLAPAGDRFTVSCQFDPARKDTELKIYRYDEHDIYVSVPENCQIAYQGRNIITFKMAVNLVVRLVGQQETINAEVQSTGIFGLAFTSVDPNYKVESMFLAQHSITEILNGFVGKNLFGSGFPSIYRRYPAIRILDDRIIFFDPSQA